VCYNVRHGCCNSYWTKKLNTATDTDSSWQHQKSCIVVGTVLTAAVFCHNMFLIFDDMLGLNKTVLLLHKLLPKVLPVTTFHICNSAIPFYVCMSYSYILRFFYVILMNCICICVSDVTIRLYRFRSISIRFFHQQFDLDSILFRFFLRSAHLC